MSDILRSTNNSDEILHILEQMVRDCTPCTIWQNISEKKLHTECYIERIDLTLQVLVLRPTLDFFPVDFKKRFQLYFRGKTQSILFKELAHFTSDKLLVINIPREIKLLEKRSKPRLDVTNKENRIALVTKYDQQSLEARYFDLELLDISQGGLSFFMTSQQAGSIAQGDQLFFSQILSIKLQAPILATVRYATPTKLKLKLVSKKGIKVGVAFETALEEILWKELSA